MNQTICDLRQSIAAIKDTEKLMNDQIEIMEVKDIIYCVSAAVASGIVTGLFTGWFSALLFIIPYTILYKCVFNIYEITTHRQEKRNNYVLNKYQQRESIDSLEQFLSLPHHQKDIVHYLHNIGSEEFLQQLKIYFIDENYASAASHLLYFSFLGEEEKAQKKDERKEKQRKKEEKLQLQHKISAFDQVMGLPQPFCESQSNHLKEKFINSL